MRRMILNRPESAGDLTRERKASSCVSSEKGTASREQSREAVPAAQGIARQIIPRTAFTTAATVIPYSSYSFW